MKTLLLALALCGCQVESTASDLAGNDLSQSQPDFLCTTSACAAQPCTPGCVFDAMVSGACPSSSPAHVGTAKATACTGWCGLQELNVGGCLRYRSEDPACPTWCISYDQSCWEHTPEADYAGGGAICSAGYCYGGGPLEDLWIPCVDMTT
jgi:hypothetical protein